MEEPGIAFDAGIAEDMLKVFTCWREYSLVHDMLRSLQAKGFDVEEGTGVHYQLQLCSIMETLEAVDQMDAALLDKIWKTMDEMLARDLSAGSSLVAALASVWSEVRIDFVVQKVVMDLRGELGFDACASVEDTANLTDAATKALNVKTWRRHVDESFQEADLNKSVDEATSDDVQIILMDLEEAKKTLQGIAANGVANKARVKRVFNKFSYDAFLAKYAEFYERCFSELFRPTSMILTHFHQSGSFPTQEPNEDIDMTPEEEGGEEEEEGDAVMQDDNMAGGDDEAPGDDEDDTEATEDELPEQAGTAAPPQKAAKSSSKSSTAQVLREKRRNLAHTLKTQPDALESALADTEEVATSRMASRKRRARELRSSNNAAGAEEEEEEEDEEEEDEIEEFEDPPGADSKKKKVKRASQGGRSLADPRPSESKITFDTQDTDSEQGDGSIDEGVRALPEYTGKTELPHVSATASSASSSSSRFKASRSPAATTKITTGPSSNGGKRKRRKWTEEEVENLERGVEEFGVGSWARIHAQYFEDSMRTQVDLKDKWRNLQKA